MPREPIDFLIVGAGFSGLVMAERLSSRLGMRCVVVDKRPHVGGNARDHFDAAGVLVHDYGPHYFRTNSQKVAGYLSLFTAWRPVDFTIKSFAGGSYWSFPVNLNTFEELTGKAETEESFRDWLEANRIPIDNPRNSEEVILSQAGRVLYEKFFEGYTLKHWKRHPSELDPSVCARIPIRTNRDDRYFNDTFQGLPADGYTSLFRKMIDASPGLRVLLETSLDEARRLFSFKHLVYTGPIDAFFGHAFGILPYRSLLFEPESFRPADLSARPGCGAPPGFWQPAVQVNYPDIEVPFTRIVELKHATGQSIPNTTIVREYPAEYADTGEPFYPVPAPDARAMFARYKELADRETNTTFLGRLPRYQYYNMDQVVAMALKAADDAATRVG